MESVASQREFKWNGGHCHRERVRTEWRWLMLIGGPEKKDENRQTRSKG